jgi:hypothetical protein
VDQRKKTKEADPGGNKREQKGPMIRNQIGSNKRSQEQYKVEI